LLHNLKTNDVNTIVIKPKSKSNFDLIVTLAKKLGEKTNILTDKVISDALFAAEIESAINDGLLNNSEKEAFLKEIRSK